MNGLEKSPIFMSLIENEEHATMDRLVAVYNRLSTCSGMQKEPEISLFIPIPKSDPNKQHMIDYINLFAAAAGADEEPEIRITGTSLETVFADFKCNLVGVLACLISEIGYIQFDRVRKDTVSSDGMSRSINGVVFGPNDHTLKILPKSKNNN